MANYRSVAQGVNDSSEEMFEGASRASYDSRYDIAYTLYKKPEYAKIILNAENAHRDLFSVKGNCPIYRMTIAINPAILTMEELLFFVQTRRIGRIKTR